MKRPFHRLVASAVTVVIAFALGCNMPNAAGGGKPDLKAAFQIYQDHIDENRAGPAGWDEFIAYASKYDAAKNPDSVQRLRDAGYQFKWGVKYTDATDGVSQFILAQAPGKPTLMLDGAIQ